MKKYLVLALLLSLVNTTSAMLPKPEETEDYPTAGNATNLSSSHGLGHEEHDQKIAAHAVVAIVVLTIVWKSGPFCFLLATQFFCYQCAYYLVSGATRVMLMLQ